jgi:hypothetical protein
MQFELFKKSKGGDKGTNYILRIERAYLCKYMLKEK